MGTKEANALLQQVWNDIQRRTNERDRAAARANPKAHKLTKLMEGKANYFCYSTKNKRGHGVAYCWTVHRNVAGYFLGWREVERPATRKEKKAEPRLLSVTKRDQYIARKSRKAAEIKAWDRYVKQCAAIGVQPTHPDPRANKRTVSEAQRARLAALRAANPIRQKR